MPNWKTHLEVSNRINQTYGFKGEDLKKFLFGSILPDINNAHIVTDISTKLNHEITHCFDIGLPSYLVFYKKYKEQIDNHEPLFVGYVTHLYTDYTWNNNFYTNVKKRNYPEQDKATLRIMKRSDFKVFNNRFIERFIDVETNEEFEMLQRESTKLDEVKLTENDIRNVVEFLKIQPLYEGELQFYTIQELEELFEKTIENLSIDDTNSKTNL